MHYVHFYHVHFCSCPIYQTFLSVSCCLYLCCAVWPCWVSSASPPGSCAGCPGAAKHFPPVPPPLPPPIKKERNTEEVTATTAHHPSETSWQQTSWRVLGTFWRRQWRLVIRRQISPQTCSCPWRIICWDVRVSRGRRPNRPPQTGRWKCLLHPKTFMQVTVVYCI